MRRRYTTAREDAAFLFRRLAEGTREWKVGDECMSWNMQTVTRVKEIRGDIVHLENGDHMHRTKMRVVKP